MNTSSNFSPVRNNTCFFMIVMVAFAIITTAIGPQAFCQTYQLQPNRSVIYPTPTTGPPMRAGRIYEIPSGNQTAIYPGQIINGERVVAIKSATPRQTITRQPITSANQSGPSNGSKIRADKIPPTVFPSPAKSRHLAPRNLPDTETPVVAESSNNLSQKNRPKLSPDRSTPPIDENLIKEIREIRDLFGGGIGKTLEGLDEMPPINGLSEIEIAPAQNSQTDPKATSAEAMFEEQLRSVITADSPRISDTGRAIQIESRGHEQIAAEINELREQLGGGIAKSLEGLGEMPVIGSAEKKETLRNCASELETLAARLEDIGVYDTADRLRSHAASLWNQARQ